MNEFCIHDVRALHIQTYFSSLNFRVRKGQFILCQEEGSEGRHKGLLPLHLNKGNLAIVESLLDL